MEIMRNSEQTTPQPQDNLLFVLEVRDIYTMCLITPTLGQGSDYFTRVEDEKEKEKQEEESEEVDIGIANAITQQYPCEQ